MSARESHWWSWYAFAWQSIGFEFWLDAVHRPMLAGIRAVRGAS